MIAYSKLAELDENKRKRDPESSGDEQHANRRFNLDPFRTDPNGLKHVHTGTQFQTTSVDPTAQDLDNGVRRPDYERQSAYFLPKRTATNSSLTSSGHEAAARFELAADWYICLHKDCESKPAWFETLQAFYDHDTQRHDQPRKIVNPVTPHRHETGCEHPPEHSETGNGPDNCESQALLESTASPAEDAKLIHLTRRLFKVDWQELEVDGETAIVWWCAEDCRGSKKGYFESEPAARKHQRCHISEDLLPRRCDLVIDGQVCGRRFLYKSALAEHQKRWHLGILYHCHHCKKYSSNRFDNLRRHYGSCTRSRIIPDIEEALVEPEGFQAPAPKARRQRQPGTSARTPARHRPAQAPLATSTTPTPQPQMREPPLPAGHQAINMPPAPTAVPAWRSNRFDSMSPVSRQAQPTDLVINPALLQPSAFPPPPVPVPRSPLAHTRLPVYHDSAEAWAGSSASHNNHTYSSSSQSRAPSEGFSSAPRSRRSTKATSVSSYRTADRSYSDAVQNLPWKLALRPRPVDREFSGFGKAAPA
ncbi:hypothetical protein LTR78_001710 [Recurvomyces mirabilis]|uniref:C2H2-type domain-containing protein n=1 Tax=Recurvomyces mirabilis TaxID=574656 RepID=A0AAE0WV41_9PEZI|nr:hypothetical protein LTR78_001710 [Recurvomyces mirabilis]KAK5150216.1 hypothetical protein LTS14_010345 [Recurvomyces mirabilis]